MRIKKKLDIETVPELCTAAVSPQNSTPVPGCWSGRV